MMRYGSIYIVTNTVTGEQYVGQTRQKAARRWKTHVNTANSKVTHKYKLSKAIIEYGRDAFEFKEVFSAFDSAALNLAEINFIAELSPAYNIAKGGAGHRGVTPSPEICKARSERLKRQWANPDWRAKTMRSIQLAGQTPEASERGKKVAAIGNAARWVNHEKQEPVKKDRASSIRASWQNCVVRQRRIDGLKAALAKPEVLAQLKTASTGRKHSEKTKQAIARNKWKPVYCPELQCSFPSQKAAAEFLGVLRASVTNAVKQKGKVAGKYTLVRVA